MRRQPSVLVAGGLAILVLSCGELRAQDGTPASPKIVRVGYPVRMIPDVDPADARVAMDVWLSEVVATLGISMKVRAVFFDDLSAALAAVRAGELEVIFLPGLNYLELRGKAPVEPVLSGIRNGVVGDEYTFLVRKDRGAGSIAQLRCDRLMLESSYSLGPVLRMWLELHTGRLGRLEDRFGSIREVGKTSQAVLPVMFGQADACLVNRYGFQMMVELNPQLERELVSLAVTPPFTRGVICVRRDCPEEVRRMLARHYNIEGYPRGRQVLTLFRIDRAIPFEPDHLRAISDLLREYEALKPRPKERG